MEFADILQLKMKNIIGVLFVCTLFFSCEKNTEIENSLEGKWNMTQVIGGFTQPKNYNEGEVNWLFNLNDKKIIIENKVDIFDTFNLPNFSRNQSGTYNFEIITENNIDYLVVGERKGEIKFTESGLTIDYGIPLDDIAYIFKR